jgi:transposase
VVPQKRNRKNPWKYDRELYKQRNEAGRMFRRLKWFRRIAARYDKLELMFSGFIYLALCVIAAGSLIPHSVNRP